MPLGGYNMKYNNAKSKAKTESSQGDGYKKDIILEVRWSCSNFTLKRVDKGPWCMP